MGSPKALLDFDGVPLLTRLLAECQRSRVDRVVVVLGHDRDRIAAQIDLSSVTVAVNEQYRLGQTGSLQCGVRMLDVNTEAFLNLPVDHPLVTARDIDAVVDGYGKARGAGKSIVVPVFEGTEGRPALFDASLTADILALAPDEPMKSLIQRHRDRVHSVPIDNPFTMTDMDTPEQYRECLRLFRQRREGTGE